MAWRKREACRGSNMREGLSLMAISPVTPALNPGVRIQREVESGTEGGRMRRREGRG